MRHKFSVVMSVYRSDDPGHFKQAIDSVLGQTCPPDELILVVDGPIFDELEKVVLLYESNPLVTLLRLQDNVGLGAARHHAILNTTTPIVAVMDSDDICLPGRFEIQIEAIESMQVDVIGAYIAEFLQDPEKAERIRKVPLQHEEIVRRGRSFSPINHVTIMFRKEAYLRAGGYRGVRKVEDYDLFHRMVMAGLKFYNIPEILVYVRSSDGQYLRRHGLAYLQEELTLHRDMLRSGYIGVAEFVRNMMIRIPVRLMPVAILRGISTRILRSNSC